MCGSCLGGEGQVQRPWTHRFNCHRIETLACWILFSIVAVYGLMGASAGKLDDGLRALFKWNYNEVYASTYENIALDWEQNFVTDVYVAADGESCLEGYEALFILPWFGLRPTGATAYEGHIEIRPFLPTASTSKEDK